MLGQLVVCPLRLCRSQSKFSKCPQLGIGGIDNRSLSLELKYRPICDCVFMNIQQLRSLTPNTIYGAVPSIWLGRNRGGGGGRMGVQAVEELIEHVAIVELQMHIPKT